MQSGQVLNRVNRTLDDADARALESSLTAALVRAPAAARWLSVSMPAPCLPPERLLSLDAYDDAVFWAPPGGYEHAGVGAAIILSASGAGRFAAIREQASALFATHASLPLQDDVAMAPTLLLGGFAFRCARTSPAWSAFGDARFVLPRIGFCRRGAEALLSISAAREEFEGERGRLGLAREALAALRALGRARDERAPTPSGLSIADDEDAAWIELVSGIRGQIDAGRLEKVVAARCVRLQAAHLPEPAMLIERLRAEAPECTRFALRAGGATFLGASPERLVRRTGLAVSTEAVAGSVRGADAIAERGLLTSAKDRAEQAIVAREIRRALTPLCETLVEQGPALYRLRHVAHLRTRFEGKLRDGAHVLDLVARLHPTPAVGGTPLTAALAWIDAYERTDRGFYAGPFGAFDADGDGEFVVALRSGLFTGDTARLYAGAGIVCGSEARSELTETRWKLRALLSAIEGG